MKEKGLFETKIKPVMTYVGTIGSVLTCIAYFILVMIIIKGFSVNRDITSITTFAIVNAAIGFVIMQFMKIQGKDFAKKEHAEIVEKHNLKKVKKEKKLKGSKYFWVTTTIKDFFIKCLMLGGSTFLAIYFVIEGSGDYKLIALAFVNILMFLSFGLISLVKSYEFYVKNVIAKMKKELEDETVQREGSTLSSEATGTEEQNQIGTKEVQEVH